MQDKKFEKHKKYSAILLLTGAVVLLSGCGDTFQDTAAAIPVTPSGVATIQMSATPTTVKSDNSNTTTIMIATVSSGNAAVPNVQITLSADSGLLDTQTVTTDAQGIATATFKSGAVDKFNRTATITASAGTISSLLPVQVVGSTLSISSSATSLVAGGASAPVTITVQDAGGGAISGAPVALSQTGGGSVTLNPASGTTDANGKLVVSVTGATAGAVTLAATAAGVTASTNLTVTASLAGTFGINLLSLNGGAGIVPVTPKTIAMKIGDTLAVQVNAPAPTANVIFATTIGTWVGSCAEGSGKTFCTVAPVAGVASATLQTSVAGVANISVTDAADQGLVDTMTAGITAATPSYITLQAAPTVVPKSVGTTVGYSQLIARVYDATGAPVGGVPVAFSIVPGTGTNSGETISPVVVFTATTTSGGVDLGAAPATFTAGSLPSGAQGVHIRASVAGTTIETKPIGLPNATKSSLDMAITIGGQAGSIAFGQAAQIIDAGAGTTFYTFPMSVLVADSNGSPAPQGTVVNISVWPIAWSTGSSGVGCLPDSDGYIWDGAAWVDGEGGTFLNEDTNQNLILDPGEDGKRLFYDTGTATSRSSLMRPGGYTLALAGTKDNALTPANSWGGTVKSTNPIDPAGTASTDANGLATFNLTYTKSGSFWVVTRIKAQTMVQGTPAVGQVDFTLAASKADADPKCYLPPSPFKY
ncbi:MAG TPA: Ig-like domain-containing protein [Gallionella sp.]